MGRCTLESMVTLNRTMIEYRKEAARVFVLEPILKYYSFVMK